MLKGISQEKGAKELTWNTSKESLSSGENVTVTSPRTRANALVKVKEIMNNSKYHSILAQNLQASSRKIVSFHVQSPLILLVVLVLLL